MYIAQIKQFHSYLPTSVRAKLIKFCYFIMAVLFISCGNATPNAKTTTVATDTQTESTQTTVSTSKAKTILCFGDSITAGYGLDDTNDAYPALLQGKIASLGLDYTVVNSGVSGETSSSGKNRIDWVIKQQPAIFILELGANDGLRGVPLSETKANLQAIITTVKEKSATTAILLAGMQLPPNMGIEYTNEFKQLFYDLAKENELTLIPFLLKDVGGIASLNQNDGIHPNVAGHQIVANTVWEVLEPLVN